MRSGYYNVASQKMLIITSIIISKWSFLTIIISKWSFFNYYHLESDHANYYFFEPKDINNKSHMA